MAKKRGARKPQNVPVIINPAGGVPSNLSAHFGDCIEFQNTGWVDRIIMYVVDDPEFAAMFHPFSLIVPAKLTVTILVVDPNTGEDSTTVYFKVRTKTMSGSLKKRSPDDTYQVIVSS